MNALSPPVSPRSMPASPRSAETVAPVAIPAHYFCPITHELFTDGVQAPDGFTYERGAIERWLALQEGGRSPLGGGPMPAGQLVPNRTLMAAIASHPVAGPQLGAARQAVRAAQASLQDAGPGPAAGQPARPRPPAGPPTRQPSLITAGVAAVAVGVVGWAVGGHLGTGWQGCVEQLFDLPLGLALGPRLLGPWVGSGATLWAVAAAHGADATVGSNLTLTGLALPLLSGAAAATGGVLGFLCEWHGCPHAPFNCQFGGPTTWGAKLGAVLGVGVASSWMGYALVRALQAAWEGLEGEPSGAPLRFDATVDPLIQLVGFGAPPPLPRAESMDAFSA